MNIRSQRVAGRLMAELGQLVSNGLRDPRLSALVTITRVQLTSDLREATVFVSVLGSSKERDTALDALHSGTGFLRREAGQRLGLKHVPSLRFEPDTAIEEGDKVLGAINAVIGASLSEGKSERG